MKGFLGAICPTAQQKLDDANGQQLNTRTASAQLKVTSDQLRPQDSARQNILSDRSARSVI